MMNNCCGGMEQAVENDEGQSRHDGQYDDEYDGSM